MSIARKADGSRPEVEEDLPSEISSSTEVGQWDLGWFVDLAAFLEFGLPLELYELAFLLPCSMQFLKSEITNQLP